MKAEHEGGTLEIKNLRPICKSCNSSMGTTNMFTYVKNNYPKNIKLIKSGNKKKIFLENYNVCTDLNINLNQYLRLLLI